MENLIGRKIRGFKFYGFMWEKKKETFIDKIGEITGIEENWVKVKFESESHKWYYPLPEALNHLVEEDPIVPELGDGVEMEVSCFGKKWSKQTVFGTYKGKYITDGVVYTHARPIPVKKLTMEELEKIVGFKFEIV